MSDYLVISDMSFASFFHCVRETKLLRNLGGCILRLTFLAHHISLKRHLAHIISLVKGALSTFLSICTVLSNSLLHPMTITIIFVQGTSQTLVLKIRKTRDQREL